MKITCPKCNASGTIPNHDVPESGRFISCPRCHEGFNITKPRAENDAYMVDTCPACGFSTFGDETFATCPKCGVSVKTFIERKREEQRLKRDQELLGKKLNNSETCAPPPETSVTPVADFVDSLHPVNIISWGITAVAIIFLCIGMFGVIDYNSTAIKARLIEEGAEQVSSLYVFMHYGLMHWVKLLYGLIALATSILFMKRLKIALQILSGLLRGSILMVPLVYIISFIYWVLAPIPHTISGYFIEILNILFMTALVGAPLYLLERYLHERGITSVIKL